MAQPVKIKNSVKFKIDKFKLFSIVAWAFFIGTMTGDILFLKNVREQVDTQVPTKITTHTLKVDSLTLKKAVDRYNNANSFTSPSNNGTSDPFSLDIKPAAQ